MISYETQYPSTDLVSVNNTAAINKSIHTDSEVASYNEQPEVHSEHEASFASDEV